MFGVVSPAATATTKDAQIKISLAIIETCPAQISRAEPAVSCRHERPSRIFYGGVFAVIQDVTQGPASENPAQSVEIAF